MEKVDWPLTLFFLKGMNAMRTNNLRALALPLALILGSSGCSEQSGVKEQTKITTPE